MTVLTALVDDVIELTNRQDLVRETTSAVRTATLMMHKLDFFPKDLRSEVLQFSTASYLQQIEYSSIFPRFRSVSSIRKYQPASLGTSESFGNFITEISPLDSIGAHGKEKTDVFYLAGDIINIRSSSEIQFVLFSLYQLPDVSDAGYSSWIEREHRDAIKYQAASLVFGPILRDREGKAMADSAALPFITQLKNSNIIATGS